MNLELKYAKHYLDNDTTVVYGCPTDEKNDFKKKLDLSNQTHTDLSMTEINL